MALNSILEILSGTKRLFVGLQGKKSDSTMETLKTNDVGALKVDGTILLSGSNVTLLNAVSTTGAGTTVAVNSYKSYVFEVFGSATSLDIQIQVIGPSGTPKNLKIWDELNNQYLTGDITAKGFYSVSVPGFTNLQANIVSVSGGNVSVVGGLMQ